VLSTGWEELDKILKIYPGSSSSPRATRAAASTFLFNLIINLCWRTSTRRGCTCPRTRSTCCKSCRDVRRHAGRQLFGAFAHTRCFVQSSRYEHYNDEPRTIDVDPRQRLRGLEKDKINLVLIDPWNELERAKAEGRKPHGLHRPLPDAVKMFARETGCTMFMVAHPTKAANGRDVTLADIEGSMHWFNKCDNGLIVKHEAGSRETIVISAKVREQPYAGRLGHCIFLVDQNTGMFTEQVGGGQAL
jgi:hypothetical protein